MKTYQDLIALDNNEAKRAEFILCAIREHKASDLFQNAEIAEAYYNHKNVTIINFQKFVYNQFGQKIPDIWSPNHQIASNWYNYFVTQAVSYLLGNGISFKNKDTKEKLGKNFDKNMVELLTAAQNGAVSFGFWNFDHLDVFRVTEFVPLYDEENGALRAGIRFWQSGPDKPMRAILYEEDGYTDYIKKKDDASFSWYQQIGKRSYIEKVKKSKIDGTVIYGGRNYPTFPIVPLWNTGRKTELEGNRGTIDAFDLTISGLINNIDGGEFIYWILKNCGGMSEVDEARFIEQIKLTHVLRVDNDDGQGADAQAHQATIPVDATSEGLDRLKDQLFHDFMAINVEDISANATNDQIKAAYEPLNQKTDKIEYAVTDFIEGLLAVAGIQDSPSYTRSQMSNQKELLDMVLSAAEYLDEEYVTEKILTLLGDADKIDAVKRRKTAEEAARVTTRTNTEEEEETGADKENGGSAEE